MGFEEGKMAQGIKSTDLACHTGQINAALPLIQQRECRAGSKAVGRREGGALMDARVRSLHRNLLEVGEEPNHGSMKRAIALSEVSRGPQPLWGSSSGYGVPPLPGCSCSGQVPPSPQQSWISREVKHQGTWGQGRAGFRRGSGSQQEPCSRPLEP